MSISYRADGMMNRSQFLVAIILVVSLATLLSRTAPVSHAQDLTESTTQTNESHTQTDELTSNTTALVTGNGEEGNVTVNDENMTEEIMLNQTGQVEMDNLVIISSSDNQVIENVAYNDSAVDIRLNQNGTVSLQLHVTVKPIAVYADDELLPEVSSLTALSLSHGGAWFYDDSTHMLFIFADPVHLIFRYRAATTPVPEFPSLSILATVFTVFASLHLIKRRRTGKQLRTG
jgi:hypothetical protein